MAIATFDTLAYSKTLQAAGMERKQAEAFAEAQVNAMSEMVVAKELATKSDILKLEQRLIKWVVGIAFTQTAIIVAIIGIGFAILKP